MARQTKLARGIDRFLFQSPYYAKATKGKLSPYPHRGPQCNL